MTMDGPTEEQYKAAAEWEERELARLAGLDPDSAAKELGYLIAGTLAGRYLSEVRDNLGRTLEYDAWGVEIGIALIKAAVDPNGTDPISEDEPELYDDTSPAGLAELQAPVDSGKLQEMRERLQQYNENDR
jgi:hypothetical protein